jgi:hypothetical protein
LLAGARVVACAVPLFLATTSALAGNPVAEQMFQDARELMKKGDYQAACPKLEASHKLEARSGTLIVLANCHEQIGKTATAWVEYKDAAALAQKSMRRVAPPWAGARRTVAPSLLPVAPRAIPVIPAPSAARPPMPNPRNKPKSRFSRS